MQKKLIRFDWAMKTILRDKANFDVLEGFLCALLDDDEIKIINLLESEGNQTDETDKFNRVDLLVQDNQNRKIIIEIQNTRESDYLERVLYGTSKVIVENQNLSGDFSDISKVISISILYFNLGFGDDYLYYGTTEFKGMNTGTSLIVKKRIETVDNYIPKIHFTEKKIFPEYYLITVERYQNIIKKKIDEWIYIIKNSEVAEGSKSKNIDKAKQKLTEVNMSPEERKRYERFLISVIRERDILRTAIEEGEIKGIKKGEKKGREEGEKKGREEKLIEIAKKCLKKQMSIEEIIELTGLTKQEIIKLKQII